MAMYPNTEEQINNIDELFGWLIKEGIEVLEQAPAPSPREAEAQLAEEQEAEERALAAEAGPPPSAIKFRLYLHEIGATDLLHHGAGSLALQAH